MGQIGGVPPISTFETRLGDTRRPQPESARTQQTFYRHLEETLDIRRGSSQYYSIVENAWQADDAVDFCSGDILGLGRSEQRRAEFLDELARHPNFSTGSSGVRLVKGIYTYLEQAGRDIAAFHGAECGLIVGSAYEANVAIWTAIPRAGDVAVYDSLVHARTHEGLKQSFATDKFEFPHNDVEAFRGVLLDVLASQKLARQNKRSVLVAIESIHSMDGDICPLQVLIDVADEVSGGQGNIQFVVDEAHSIGVIGRKGAGLVCHLDLQRDIAVEVHSYGKAIGAAGGMSARSFSENHTIRGALANFARSIVYSTSPSFPFIGAIKSGHKLLETPYSEKAQEHVQCLARLFFESLTSHHTWSAAGETGLLRSPLTEGWKDRSFLTHVLPIYRRPKHKLQHLVVPRGQGRLQLILHAPNTAGEVQRLVDAVFSWVEEMIEIQDGISTEIVPHAARQVYEWMRQEGLVGYGMV
ncbi:5-aminolevulinate synthase [Xylariaceae sp. FL0804]|nr:5-aminolevulinate synthase [Xylariaceae sp. FL0804]